MLQLKFINPNERIQGENKSKLLDPECELYIYVKQIRDLLSERGVVFDTRPPHIELSRMSNLDPIELAKRANSIHLSCVYPKLDLMVQKALVIHTGVVDQYGSTHCTIAYFKQGLNQEQYSNLLKIVLQTATEEEITSFIAGTKAAHSGRPKDWMCTVCNFLVFGSKTECRKCSTQRA